MKPTCVFLIPRVFGWQVIKKTLENSGFNKINILDCATEEYLTRIFKIRAVPPINVTGLETGATQNELSIDGGFSIVNRHNGLKLVFLADNNLYSTERIRENLSLLQAPDLIAFAYSGFASDYPFNFNFALEKKLQICDTNENRRFSLQVEHLKLINPKFILPYSSEFVPIGSHAQGWIEVFPHIWTSSKDGVAKRYGDELGVDYGSLYPGEAIVFSGTTREKFNSSFNRETFPTELIDYFRENSASYNEYGSEDDKVDSMKLTDLLCRASKNYASSCERFSLSPKQCLYFYADDSFVGSLTETGTFEEQERRSSESAVLQLSLSSALFKDLLEGKQHWNDACLSMRVHYDRTPNFFCDDTLNALNYLRSSS